MMQGRLCSNSGRFAVGMSNNNDHESVSAYIAVLMDTELYRYHLAGNCGGAKSTKYQFFYQAVIPASITRACTIKMW